MLGCLYKTFSIYSSYVGRKLYKRLSQLVPVTQHGSLLYLLHAFISWAVYKARKPAISRAMKFISVQSNKHTDLMKYEFCRTILCRENKPARYCADLH